jgi:catechol 2,3-dioxygenase-like lactoylglutathione lyase family enzyme
VNRIVEVSLFTDDVAASAELYGHLLGSRPQSEWPGGAIFAAGDARVLLHERSASLPDGPPNEDHIALAVPDLDCACAELIDQGVTLLLGPRDYPWGRSAYLRDPDGRLVELTQA